MPASLFRRPARSRQFQSYPDVILVVTVERDRLAHILNTARIRSQDLVCPTRRACVARLRAFALFHLDMTA